jgi:hypothetical protein
MFSFVSSSKLYYSFSHILKSHGTFENSQHEDKQKGHIEFDAPTRKKNKKETKSIVHKDIKIETRKT